MSTRRQVLLLSLWAAFLALVVLVFVNIRDQPPAPPQASLGTLTQAVLNSDRLATLPLQILNGFIGNPNASYLISIGAPLVLFLATQQFFRRGLVSATLL